MEVNKNLTPARSSAERNGAADCGPFTAPVPGEFPFLPRLSPQQLRQTDPLVLAYVGDAVYELFVRLSLSDAAVSNSRMHMQAVSIVNAPSQQRALRLIRGDLTDEERDVFRRGRNSSGHAHPKHASPMEYADATGVEALFGWLWLGGRSLRAWDLFNIIWTHRLEVADPDSFSGGSADVSYKGE